MLDFYDKRLSLDRWACGRLRPQGGHHPLADNVAIKEVSEKIWQVPFLHYDLGFFDDDTERVTCAESPVAARVLPVSPV
jgi:putative transposase